MGRVHGHQRGAGLRVRGAPSGLLCAGLGDSVSLSMRGGASADESSHSEDKDLECHWVGRVAV